MAKRVKKKEKLHDLMDTFLDRDRPGDSQLEATLESLLAADRAFEKPESDLESTKEFRYECAARIQEKIRTLYYYKDYQHTVVEITIILDVPRTCLEPKGWLDTDQDASTLQGKLFDIGWLVGHCKFHLSSAVYHMLIHSSPSQIQRRSRDHAVYGCHGF
jgi:hypothetical protein